MDKIEKRKLSSVIGGLRQINEKYWPDDDNPRCPWCNGKLEMYLEDPYEYFVYYYRCEDCGDYFVRDHGFWYEDDGDYDHINR